MAEEEKQSRVTRQLLMHWLVDILQWKIAAAQCGKKPHMLAMHLQAILAGQIRNSQKRDNSAAVAIGWSSISEVDFNHIAECLLKFHDGKYPEMPEQRMRAEGDESPGAGLFRQLCIIADDASYPDRLSYDTADNNRCVIDFPEGELTITYEQRK